MFEMTTSGKTYIVWKDEDKLKCCIVPLHITHMKQTLGDYYTLDSNAYTPNVNTIIEGSLGGPVRILEPKDFDDISYEELMDLIKE